MSDQREYEIQHQGYTIAGFTKPQRDDIDFDREQEDALVEACSREIAEVFGNPNRYERRLAKMENIPIDKPATKRLYDNIIYTDEKEYYCVGSGGKGGGKVFWTPYTIRDEELHKKIASDDMCDNCKTLTHENQHGIGASAEFDDFSSIPSFLFRLKNLPKGERLESRLSSLVGIARTGCESNFKERYQRKVRNVVCAINERVPDLLKEALLDYGYSEELINETLKCACGAGKEEKDDE